MAQCSAIKGNGERCRGTASGQHGYCWAHDPANAEARKRVASKGGRTKPKADGIKDVKGWLLKLASDVENGKLEAKDGSVVSQILNVYLRGVETERKIKEQEELEERLQALESVLKGRKTG
jgi:hypothetical protein